MAVALLAVFLAVGGRPAYAAAASFLLNTTNTSSAQTSLDGSAVNGPALQLTNANAGKKATALALNVASGRAPFTVNSTRKVAKLNADKLDGIDSTGFVQGSEHAVANRVGFTVPVDGAVHQATVLDVPGFGTLTANCTAFNTGSSEIRYQFANTSGIALDVDRVNIYFADPDDASKNGLFQNMSEQVIGNGGSDFTDLSFVVSAGRTTYIQADYQIGNGTGSGTRLATIHATLTMAQSSATCVGSAQAVTMP